MFGTVYSLREMADQWTQPFFSGQVGNAVRGLLRDKLKYYLSIGGWGLVLGLLLFFNVFVSFSWCFMRFGSFFVFCFCFSWSFEGRLLKMMLVRWFQW